MKTLSLIATLVLSASASAATQCQMQDFVAPQGNPIVVQTRNDSQFIDLKALLNIDEEACAGRKIRYLKVYSGGEAFLYLRSNGARANNTAAIVDRDVGYSYADWLFAPRSHLEVAPGMGNFDLEILSHDNSQPYLHIYAIEVRENL